MAEKNEAEQSVNLASSLESLYSHLSPKGAYTQLDTSTATSRVSFEDVIKDKILGSNGNFYGWENIKAAAKKYFEGKDSQVLNETRKKHGTQFHAISLNDRLDLDDQKYWGEGVTNLTNFVPTLADDKRKNKCVVSAFVSRDPFVTPATKATRDVEIFLNYMPNLAVAQMVPFLDVEFQGPGQYYNPADPNGTRALSTPSYMRFLLGSKQGLQKESVDTILYELDVLESSRIKEGELVSARDITRTGVETFLLPQTLTNMDELAPAANRLTRVKPFLPFASIEGFDVQVRNAGAGAMVTKTASLKIKLHDKARISEFAEFIRGPSGYSNLLIKTTYGWSAPQGREADEYSRFINEKLHVEDCWMVKDSQFAFEPSGQVLFTLQLVTKGMKDVERLMISAGTDEFSRQVQQVNRLRQTIASYYDRLKRSERFSIDVTATEFLNASSTTGLTGEIKNLGSVVESIINTASHSYVLNSSELEDLKRSLNEVTRDTTRVRGTFAGAVTKKFEALAKSDADPFLPRTIVGDSESEHPYFPDADIINVVEEFKRNISSRDKQIKDAIDSANKNAKGDAVIKPINFDESVKNKINVVSFGKLFLNFIAPALTSLENFDELQVFFYPLNDSTGPMSGYSIAEFPIDTVALAYAYTEELKVLNTNELTMQQFLKLVIDSQFSDLRAIGYGKNRFYKPSVPGKSKELEKIDEPELAKGEADWAKRYGGWRPPMIDFYMEVGEELPEGQEEKGANPFKPKLRKRDRKNYGPSGKLIKRIHVYDKQLDPHKFAKSILMGESDFERGEINKGRLQSYLNNVAKNLSFAQVKALREKIGQILLSSPPKSAEGPADPTISRVKEDQRKQQEIKQAIAEAGGGSLPSEPQFVDRPNKESYKIPLTAGNKREIVKAELMRFVPTLTPGTNGSLIRAINVGSKTDGAIGAANLFQVVKGGTGKKGLTGNGLEEVNNLPLRVVPIQLTMTSLGCPIAGLYQQYFIDMDTGTTIDNLYKLSQLQHTIAPGKFDSSWTFIYTDGYGKFGGAPTVASMVSKELTNLIDDYLNQNDPGKKKGK